MRARAWIAAAVVASTALLGCGGDDDDATVDPAGADGGDTGESGGDAPDIDSLELVEVGTLEKRVESIALTDEGLVGEFFNGLVRIDPQTGAVEQSTELADRDSEGGVLPPPPGTPLVQEVLGVDDTPYVLLATDGSCSVAEIDPADLTWDDPTSVEDLVCEARAWTIMAGRALSLVERTADDADGSSVRSTYHVVSVDPASGESRAVPVEVPEGYDAAFSSLIRTGDDELVVPLSKEGSPEAFALPVSLDLEIGEVAERPELATDPRVGGQLLFGPQVETEALVWGYAIDDDGGNVRLTVAEVDGGDVLAEVAVQEIAGDALSGGDIPFTASGDTAYLVVTSGGENRITTLYRVS